MVQKLYYIFKAYTHCALFDSPRVSGMSFQRSSFLTLISSLDVSPVLKSDIKPAPSIQTQTALDKFDLRYLADSNNGTQKRPYWCIGSHDDLRILKLFRTECKSSVAQGSTPC